MLRLSRPLVCLDKLLPLVGQSSWNSGGSGRSVTRRLPLCCAARTSTTTTTTTAPSSPPRTAVPIHTLAQRHVSTISRAAVSMGSWSWPLSLGQHLSALVGTTTLSRVSKTVPALSGFRTWQRSFASKKHKSVLSLSKGFRGRAKNCFRVAIRRLEKSWEYGFRDRRRKKRNWRRQWIRQIQAGVRQYGWRYSTFITAVSQSNISLNRKVLAELAAYEPFAFRSVVRVVEQVTGQRNGQPLVEPVNDVDRETESDEETMTQVNAA